VAYQTKKEWDYNKIGIKSFTCAELEIHLKNKILKLTKQTDNFAD